MTTLRNIAIVAIIGAAAFFLIRQFARARDAAITPEPEIVGPPPLPEPITITPEPLPQPIPDGGGDIFLLTAGPTVQPVSGPIVTEVEGAVITQQAIIPPEAILPQPTTLPTFDPRVEVTGTGFIQTPRFLL